jgi:hypothetical protein
VVNLFRQFPGEEGSLTASFLALLEHTDRALLNGFLERSGVGARVGAGEELRITFPDPDGPPSAGLIAAPHLHLTLLTQAPGRALPTIAAGADAIAITMTGQGPAGAAALSWEQVDRWLAEAAEQYDPQTRTGFLIRQFRDYLPEAGIAYFGGFDEEALEAAPTAFGALTSFYQTTEQFFEQLAPAIGSLSEGLAPIRQSHPEDLLAGYCYRDYSGPALGPTAFLRVALHLAQQELQTSLFLSPGEAHQRLRSRLLEDPEFVGALGDLAEEPILWLWSQNTEHRLPFADLDIASVTALPWGEFQVGIQRSQPLQGLAGAGLIERVTLLADQLLKALHGVLGTVH